MLNFNIIFNLQYPGFTSKFQCCTTAKAALKFGSKAWVLKEREITTFRSGTDEIFETLTWNNNTR